MTKAEIIDLIMKEAGISKEKALMAYATVIKGINNGLNKPAKCFGALSDE